MSGAAKEAATEAFFGGGSKASGGGGRSFGRPARNAAATGPAVLVFGAAIASQGAWATAKAGDLERAVDKEVAKHALTRARLDAIVAAVGERELVLDGLVVRATSALDLLESEPFDPTPHEFRYVQARDLTLAVCDLAVTVIADEAGTLDHDGTAITITYRAMLKEPEDD